jgi:hypothetical protein
VAFLATSLGVAVGGGIAKRELAKIPTSVTTLVAMAVAAILLIAYPTFSALPYQGEILFGIWAAMAAGLTVAVTYAVGWRYA